MKVTGLRFICSTLIEQQPNTTFPDRKKTFSFKFMTSYGNTESWDNLTDTGKMVFPKNIYFVDESGKKYSWEGKNLIGGDNTPPILLRGDKITISTGYMYFDNLQNEVTDLVKVFEGFVTKVINRMPIEIEFEDNMYLLKQIQCPNKVFPNAEVGEMVAELISGTPFTVVTGVSVATDIKTNIGDFRTHNETVAQVLKRLRDDYMLESYFRGNELRVSGIVYYPSDRKEHIFDFHENIISDKLEYRRKDDIQLGIKAYSVNSEELNDVNSYGHRKRRRKRLEVFVTFRGGKLMHTQIDSGIDKESTGEIRTLYFWNVKTVDELVKLAGQRLNRMYYEGYVGTFVTFGLPVVHHGDAVIFRDNILPDREGTYLVKSVARSFSFSNGLRQEITIDIRLDKLTEAEIQAGL